MQLPKENRSVSGSSNRSMPISRFRLPEELIRFSSGIVTIAFLLLLSCTFPGIRNQTAAESSTEPSQDLSSPRPMGLERAIEVVQSHSGVYLYTYAETMEQIDPRKDYLEKYRVYGEPVIGNLRRLIAENREYSPDYKARCLPVWDYGLEFREEKSSVMFLFSFRCNTIRYVEGNLFKDFTPQRTEFFKIFHYDISPGTASLLEKKQ